MLPCHPLQKGWTPLHYASDRGYVPIARLLLKHHATPDLKAKVWREGRRGWGGGHPGKALQGTDSSTPRSQHPAATQLRAPAARFVAGGGRRR